MTEETESWTWLRKRLAVLKRTGYRFKANLRPMSSNRKRRTFEIVLYAPPGGKLSYISACYPDWYDLALTKQAFEGHFAQIRA